MKDRGIPSIAELSRILHVKSSRFNTLMCIKRLPNHIPIKNKTLNKVAKYFNVDPEYIISQDLIDVGKKLRGVKTTEDVVYDTKEFNRRLDIQEQKLLLKSNPEIGVIEGLMKECVNDEIHCVLSMLSERERTVLSLIYGLDDGIERTDAEIGRMFKVTGGCIGYIKAKALRKLKHPIRSRKLREYYTHM